MSEVVRIEELGFTFHNGNRALGNLSFAVCRGEIVRLVGSKDAGKSTLIRLIAGLLIPTRGRITLFDKEARNLDAPTKRRIGILSCCSALIDFLNVDEHLAYVGRLYGLDKTALRKRINRLKDIFGPDECLVRPNAELPASRRKKVGILTTLIHSPEFLAWDEPFRDLDPGAADRLEELIISLQKKGVTILMSSRPGEASCGPGVRVIGLDG